MCWTVYGCSIAGTTPAPRSPFSSISSSKTDTLRLLRIKKNTATETLTLVQNTHNTLLHVHTARHCRHPCWCWVEREAGARSLEYCEYQLPTTNYQLPRPGLRIRVASRTKYRLRPYPPKMLTHRPTLPSTHPTAAEQRPARRSRITWRGRRTTQTISSTIVLSCSFHLIIQQDRGPLFTYCILILYSEFLL